MDSGNNRYELLFIDDDISDSLDNIVAKTKKQVKTSTAGSGAGGATQKTTNKQSAEGKSQSNKKQNQAEKENKPSAINKNEASKKQQTAGGAAAAAAGDKLNKQGGAGAAAGNAGGANNANRKPRNGPGAGVDGSHATGGGGGARNPVGGFRQQQNGETREQRNNRRNVRENGFNPGGNVGEGQSQQPRQYRDRDNRGPPRNRNFEGGSRGGKREFDRQSGSDKTGVKAVDKRDGAGAHNWGSVKDAIDDVNKNDTEGVSGDKADESGNEQTEPTALVEEETKELTLDEWKAQKQQRAKPIFNIRKAGEGEDTSQWKKMIVLNNNKKKENESEEELEFDPAMYPQRVGRQQRVLDIQFNFNDGRRGGGGGFGGRGRGRGPRPGGTGVGAGGSGANTGGDRPIRGGFEGRSSGGPGGRGGKRNFGGDRQQQNAPKVNDERQFPTLA